MPTSAEVAMASSGAGDNDAHVGTVLSSPKELERVGAGYALGNQAARGDDTAVVALMELLQTGSNNARRAAMYGLAASGDVAVPQLTSLITTLIEVSEHDDVSSQNVIVSAVLALGEASITPTSEAM